MAHKKGQSSSKNGRDSHSNRLGLKKFGGQAVKQAIFWSAKGEPFTIPART